MGVLPVSYDAGALIWTDREQAERLISASAAEFVVDLPEVEDEKEAGS